MKLVLMTLMALSSLPAFAAGNSQVVKALKKNPVVQAAVKTAGADARCSYQVENFNEETKEFSALVNCENGGDTAEEGETDTMIRVKGFTADGLIIEMELSIQVAG